MLTEFKKFISRGNVLDLAVGVIIGGAFGKIVSSFVADILTPVLSLALGKVDFANLFFALNGQDYLTLEEAKKAGAATINYGLFANVVIDFVIVAFAIFLIVKAANKVRDELEKKEQQLPGQPTTKECPECLSTIPLAARRCAHCTSTLA